MNNAFSNLTAAIAARLQSGLTAMDNEVTGPATATIAILTEDAGDLVTKINKAVDQIGMLILIGQPHYENQTPTAPQSQIKIKLAIAVGEVPDVWRDAAGLNPHCLDVVGYVQQLLAQYNIPGYLNLRVLRADYVPDKKRQLYELSLETSTTLNAIA